VKAEVKAEGIPWRAFLRGVVKGVRDEDTKMDILKVKNNLSFVSFISAYLHIVSLCVCLCMLRVY